MCLPNHLLRHSGSNYHQQEKELPVSVLKYAPPQVATRPCTQCGELVQEDFVFCPRCGTELLTACPDCHRAVDSSWTHCAFCGADLVASD